jgi:hypothetical protein
MLIENHTDLNCRDFRLQTPLHNAAFWSQCWISLFFFLWCFSQ